MRLSILYPHATCRIQLAHSLPVIALTVLGVSFFSSPSLSSTTYNLKSDWSDAINPNGVWSYREGNNPLPHVSQWDTSSPHPFMNQAAWARSTNGNNRVPAWFRATVHPVWEHDWEIGDILVHSRDDGSGVGNGEGNVIWTSPQAGVIEISGAIWMGREIARANNWGIYLNDVLLTSGSVSSGDAYSRNDPLPFAMGTGGASVLQDVSVVSGDVVKIEVVHTGTPFGDFAGIDLEIALVPEPENSPPEANAGPDQATRAGDTVFLDGSASFDDNTESAELQYSWAFSSSPAGSTAVLADADTPTPTFVADIPGTYVIELVVTDEGGLVGAPDAVIVSSDNLAPAADAGADQLVIVGTTVLLDGSASTDAEGNPLIFDWTLTAAPPTSAAALAGADTPSATLVPDVAGVYEVTLQVSDFIGPGDPDLVEVTVANADDFAVIVIVDANDVVSNLAIGQVTTSGNQQAIGNFLSQAAVAIEAGDLIGATDKLAKAIARTDGCALRSSPDENGPGRDWITDCAEQASVYVLLNLALDALTP